MCINLFVRKTQRFLPIAVNFYLLVFIVFTIELVYFYF